MKLLFMLIILFKATMLFASKSYSITYTIHDGETRNPISGLIIQLWNDKNELLYTKVTDESGIAQFLEVNVRSGKIEIVDPKQCYVSIPISISNSKMKSIKRTIEIFPTVMWKEEKFKRVMEERNSKYADAGPIVEKGVDSTINCNNDQYIEPQFPGGAPALQLYIARNVSYPQEAIEMNEQGRVYLAIVIEKDGSVTNISVVKKIDSQSLNYEAKRLMLNCPNWIPATCDGENVRSKAMFPINFSLK